MQDVGVGGPAMYFANKSKVTIKGITISDEQAEIAKGQVNKKGLAKRVDIQQGDYHYLTNYYEASSFDGVLFLESLGHAENAIQVIREAAKVLRLNGFIYIKDFFKKESRDIHFQNKVDTVIGRMDENYCYNTLRLIPLLEEITCLRF